MFMKIDLVVPADCPALTSSSPSGNWTSTGGTSLRRRAPARIVFSLEAWDFGGSRRDETTLSGTPALKGLKTDRGARRMAIGRAQPMLLDREADGPCAGCQKTFLFLMLSVSPGCQQFSVFRYCCFSEIVVDPNDRQAFRKQPSRAHAASVERSLNMGWSTLTVEWIRAGLKHTGKNSQRPRQGARPFAFRGDRSPERPPAPARR